jgi:cytochrome b561
MVMQVRNSTEGYGAAAQSLHWLTVLFVLLAWTLGTFGDDFPKGGPREDALFAHISLGLLIPAMLILRLILRVADRPPPFESSRWGVWPDYAAKATHLLLYTLLVLVPVAGIVAQFARGNPLPIFGMTELASPWVRDKAFAHSVTEVHEVLANALIILAGLHAFAAIVHHWVLRDRTLVRMLPRLSR